jgi:recombination protein RecA
LSWWISKRRIIEIYGQNLLEKTTLTLHLPRHKAGGIAFIDAEHAFDRNYAEKLGVDIENLSFRNLITENKPK